MLRSGVNIELRGAVKTLLLTAVGSIAHTMVHQYTAVRDSGPPAFIYYFCSLDMTRESILIVISCTHSSPCNVAAHKTGEGFLAPRDALVQFTSTTNTLLVFFSTAHQEEVFLYSKQKWRAYKERNSFLGTFIWLRLPHFLLTTPKTPEKPVTALILGSVCAITTARAVTKSRAAGLKNESARPMPLIALLAICEWYMTMNNRDVNCKDSSPNSWAIWPPVYDCNVRSRAANWRIQ